MFLIGEYDDRYLVGLEDIPLDSYFIDKINFNTKFIFNRM